MAVKTRQDQRATIYFVTFTCHRWLPLFEETKLYDNIYGWFKIPILMNPANKRIVVYGPQYKYGAVENEITSRGGTVIRDFEDFLNLIR